MTKFDELLKETDNLCDEIDNVENFKQLRQLTKIIDDKLNQMMDIIDSEE